MTETELLRYAIIDLAARVTTAAMICNEHVPLESALETAGIEGHAAVVIRSLLADVFDSHGAATVRVWNHSDGSPIPEWAETRINGDRPVHVLQLTPRRAVLLKGGDDGNPFEASLVTTRDGRYVSTVVSDLVPTTVPGDVVDAERAVLPRLERRARDVMAGAAREHAVLAHALRDAEFTARQKALTESES